jgi:hypothetical protein
LFNNLVLVLNQIFCHRDKATEREDVNPPEDVQVHADSRRDHGDKSCENEKVKAAPDKSVLRFKVGDEIKFGEEGFVNIYKAFFPENKMNS